MASHLQDVTDSVFYDEFGRIMMNAPIVGLDFTRYLPVIIVPYALLQVGHGVVQYVRAPMLLLTAG